MVDRLKLGFYIEFDPPEHTRSFQGWCGGNLMPGGKGSFEKPRWIATSPAFESATVHSERKKRETPLTGGAPLSAAAGTHYSEPKRNQPSDFHRTVEIERGL